MLLSHQPPNSASANRLPFDINLRPRPTGISYTAVVIQRCLRVPHTGPYSSLLLYAFMLRPPAFSPANPLGTGPWLSASFLANAEVSANCDPHTGPYSSLILYGFMRRPPAFSPANPLGTGPWLSARFLANV